MVKFQYDYTLKQGGQKTTEESAIALVAQPCLSVPASLGANINNPLNQQINRKWQTTILRIVYIVNPDIPALIPTAT
jgi:hypothetical protein